MTRCMIKKLTSIVLFLFICSGFPLLAYSEALNLKAQDIIKDRQDIMQEMSDVMTAIDNEISSKTPSTEFIKKKIKSLFISQKNMAFYYDKKTNDSSTESKAINEIWNYRDEFLEYLSIYNESFDEFSQSMISGDWNLIRKTFKQFGDTCWTCHMKFKKSRCRGGGRSLLQRAKTDMLVRSVCLRCHTDVPPKQWQVLR